MYTFSTSVTGAFVGRGVGLAEGVGGRGVEVGMTLGIDDVVGEAVVAVVVLLAPPSMVVALTGMGLGMRLGIVDVVGALLLVAVVVPFVAPLSPPLPATGAAVGTELGVALGALDVVGALVLVAVVSFAPPLVVVALVGTRLGTALGPSDSVGALLLLVAPASLIVGAMLEEGAALTVGVELGLGDTVGTTVVGSFSGPNSVGAGVLIVGSSVGILVGDVAGACSGPFSSSMPPPLSLMH